MADPVIISRPSKVVSGFTSDWVACGGRLPVQYEIQNDKFPVNSVDTIYNVTQVNDNGGLAQIQTSIGGIPITTGQYVELTNFSNDSYNNKVALVVSDDGTNLFTVNISFNGTDTGNTQRFYLNYATEVRIYAGIDSSSSIYSFFDPTELVSTIKQIPESDNITRIDVSQIVKTKLSAEKNVIGGNDINAWKDFYIEFREVFTGSSTSFIDDSSNVYHAVYGVLQFRNPNGGNMADFVSRAFAGQFMTDFEKPVIYPNISTISILLESVNDLKVEQLDKNGTEVQSDVLTVNNNGYGLYRVPLTFTQSADAESLNIYLL